MTHKKTKIICTIGPASSSKKTIEAMVRAGMNAARLNFSHGSYAEFAEIIKNIRSVGRELDVPIALVQDLQGPKIRVGKMPNDGIAVKKGDRVMLTTRAITGGRRGSANATNAGDSATIIVPIQYKKLPREVHSGDMIAIDDGILELGVKRVHGDTIETIARNDWTIKTNKGINVPGVTLSAASLTKKDLQDLAFGIKHGVDYVALSFVKSARDVMELQKRLKRAGSVARVMAKIERAEAIDNIDAIVQAADAIMVARGDLGIEIPAENVPLVQKRIIHLCNQYGKPVITATHILNSMVDNPRATRAEISDAANAVFDHSDALMLSNETAVGHYPIEAVKTLARVAHATESSLQKYEHLLPYKRQFDMPITNATCLNATKLALDIDADAIVAISQSGYTAQHIAKHRIYKPIITIVSSEKVRNQLALVWGLNDIFIRSIHFKNIAHDVTNLLRQKNLASAGQEIVIVTNASKKEKNITTTVA